MAPRIAALGAAAIVAAVASLYLYGALVGGEDADTADVAVFVLALGIAGALAAAGSFLPDAQRRFGVLTTAAVLATVLAVISGYSVGPLLVPAVLLLLYAAFSGH